MIQLRAHLFQSPFIIRSGISKLIIPILLLTVFVGACKPEVVTKILHKHPPLAYSEQVTIFSLEEGLPPDYDEVGTISVGESGFTTKCSWYHVIIIARNEAQRMGANAIKIIEQVAPNGQSSCYQITAIALRKNENYGYEEALTEENILPANADYALIHLYRFSSVGPLIKYNLYLNEHFVTRTESNWKETIKITQAGDYTLWAQTETQAGIPLRIEPGNEYFIRCALITGAAIIRPKITLVSNTVGRKEFASIPD